MKARLFLGFGALMACVAMPWLARLPKGLFGLGHAICA